MDSSAAGKLAFPKLPAPSAALTKARQTSALYLHEGSGYVGSLPNSNVTVDGSSAIFSPNWGEGASGIGDAAYALYSFNLDGEPNRILHLVDAATDVEKGDVWVGFGDFEKDIWDWQKAQELSPMRFDAGDNISAGGDVIMALLLTGHQKMRVNSLSFLSVDETEDNDSQGEGYVISGWNSRGLTGSLGNSPAHPGVDGDFVDWWRIDASYPTTPEFQTEIVVQAAGFFSENSPFIEVSLYNSTGTPIAEDQLSFIMFSPGDDGFTSQADLPLFVKVELVPAFDGNYAEYEMQSFLTCPPTAALTQTATSGDLPLTIDFDASGSSGSAESPISYYEWYFTYDPQDSQAQPDLVTYDPTTSFTFTEMGYYPLFVRVVTETGSAAAAYGLVNAGDIPYDEREFNDYYQEANLLPAASGSGWKGNLGQDPVTAPPFHGWDGGYNGSDRDSMGFEIQPGQAIRYSIVKTSGAGNPFSLEIHGSEDSGFDQSNPRFDDMDWRQYFRDSMFFSTAYTPALQVIAEDNGDYGDYELSWIVGTPPHSQSLVPNPSSGPAPLTVTFTPGAVDDDGVIDHYIWDTNDDNISDQTSTGPIELTFDTPGSYRIECFPIDDEGFSTYFQAFVDINVS
ncbi:PKD domain-containing protein [bacterium]|nr:PKD domain-containing protein [bacterium]